MTEREAVVAAEIEAICQALNAISQHRSLYGGYDPITKAYVLLLKKLGAACERLIDLEANG